MICDTCSHISVCKKKEVIQDKIDKAKKSIEHDIEDISFEFKCKNYESYMVRNYKTALEIFPYKIYDFYCISPK